ncbi:MAG: hypothetical protein Q4D76_03075 [Oscillospiraceae bacterium]|nr:hypothetical protein [Oscillospiraceae bacterium]
MLLPVETQYDGNRVYTEAAEDGTYCIVDMDKWIENTAETTEVQSAGDVYNAVYASSEAKSLESLEVYFLMYIRSSSIDSARSSVANASRAIIDYCNSTGRDVRLYFAGYTGATAVSNETGNSYADNASTDEEIQEMLSGTDSATGSLDTTNFDYSLTRALKKSLLEISGTNENSKKYCFVVDVNFEPKSASNVAVVDEMKSYGVDFSFICNDHNSNIVNYESLSSDGTHIRWTPDFSEVITDKVLGAVVTYNVNTGLCNKIPYNEALITSEWKDIYEKFYSGKLSIDEIKKLGLPDTDGDGNPDCLEIFMKYISFDENGNIILPAYDELARDTMGNSRFGLKGLDELVSIMKKKGMNISDLRILPLISNPAFEDSDFDGIPDSTDKRPSEEDIISVDDNIIDDSRVFESDYKTISNNAVDGNGIASSHSGDKKNNIIKYARLIRADGKATSKFYIEPDNNSDYLITVDTGKYDDCQIKVSYEKGIIFKKDVAVSDIELDEGIEEKEQNGNVMHNRKAYSLEKGKKYKVIVTIASTDFAANNYSVSFEQNNWVHAPNGGIQHVVPYNCYFPVDRMFIATDTFKLALQKNHKIMIDENSDTESQTKAIMKQLGLDDGKKVLFDSFLTAVGTCISGSATAAAIVDPEPGTKIIIACIADGINTYFVASSIKSTFGYFESKDFENACNEGDINLIFTKKGQVTFFQDLWDPWKTAPYISKYDTDSMNGRTKRTIDKNITAESVISYCGLK